MKCIHYYMPDNRVARVGDEDAKVAVGSGKARYVPKSVWKQKVRDFVKNTA